MPRQKDGDKEQGPSHHDRLLQKLSARARGSGVGVVLTPEDMQALRDLSSLVPPEPESAAEPPRRPRRTSDISISDAQQDALDEIALGQAHASQRGRSVRPRRRTSEIEVSTAELELLRRLSFDREAAGPTAAGVQEQLQAAPRKPKRPVTLELTRNEARWLSRAARAREDELSEEERRSADEFRARIAELRGGRSR